MELPSLDIGDRGESYPVRQELRKEVEEGVLHLKAKSLTSSMHLRETRERVSTSPLEVRVFLRF
jgi:hypothetical protein